MVCGVLFCMKLDQPRQTRPFCGWHYKSSFNDLALSCSSNGSPTATGLQAVQTGLFLTIITTGKSAPWLGKGSIGAQLNRTRKSRFKPRLVRGVNTHTEQTQSVSSRQMVTVAAFVVSLITITDQPSGILILLNNRLQIFCMVSCTMAHWHGVPPCDRDAVYYMWNLYVDECFFQTTFL